MVAHLLGDDEGSKLYWALVETGLAEDANAQYDGRDGCGEILVTAVCDPEDAAEVEAICRREMSSLLDAVDEDDLLRARSKIATAVTLAGERPAGRMNRIGALLSYGEPYRTLEDELACIDAVTIDDLRAYARRWPIAPVLAARLGPAK
jgi:predicted Zn-dependent peptidase